MSQFDEIDYDKEEMDDFFEEGESMTPEEIFKMVLINRSRGTIVRIELHDKEGNEVKLSEIIEELLDYVEKELSDGKESNFTDQVMPLMGQSIATGLYGMMGARETAYFLTDKVTLDALLRMMSISFLLLMYVQDNNLTIKTFEEEVSEEELESMERKAALSSIAMKEVLKGQNPRRVLDELINAGKITQAEVDEMLEGLSEEDFEE